MGIALPPRIYDTKSAANRKLKTSDSENRVFQQNRPQAIVRTPFLTPLLSSTADKHWKHASGNAPCTVSGYVIILASLSIANTTIPDRTKPDSEDTVIVIANILGNSLDLCMRKPTPRRARTNTRYHQEADA